MLVVLGEEEYETVMEFSLVYHNNLFGTSVMVFDAFHKSFKQVVLHIQTHIICHHCPQGDFDIIGGASALTEAEVIKVLFCIVYF